MLSKLKRRFLLINLSILLTVFIAIFGGTYYLMYQSGKSQAIAVMEQMAQNNSGPNKTHPKDLNPFFTQQSPHAFNANLMKDCFMLMLNNNNEVSIASNTDDIDLSNVNTLVTTVLNNGDSEGIVEFNDLSLRYLKDYRIDGGINLIFLDRTTELSTLSQLMIVLIVIGSISIITLAVISYYLATWAMRPVAVAWQKQQQFVADASHELKTPLTVIQTTADVLISNKEKTIASEQKWLDYIKSETNRLSKLVNDLLYLAKADSNELKIKHESFNLSEAFINVILPFESIVFESDKELIMNIEPDLIYAGEEERLQQVAIILLDNALKHAPVHSAIEIKLAQVNHMYQLSVSNQGEGIAPEHLDKIFERFYRADASRARDTGGYGLGLSIAKSIVTQHQGNISVQSELNKLTTFTVSLPIKN